MSKKKRSKIGIVAVVILIIIVLIPMIYYSARQSGVYTQAIPDIVGNEMLGSPCQSYCHCAGADYSSCSYCPVYYPISLKSDFRMQLGGCGDDGCINEINILGDTVIPAWTYKRPSGVPKIIRDDQFYKAEYDNAGQGIVHTKFVENDIFELVDVDYNYVKEDLPYFYKDIEPKLITITLNSKFSKAIDVELYVWLEDTLNIAGMHIIDLSRKVTISPGINEYVFELPLKLESQEYSINFFFGQNRQMSWAYYSGYGYVSYGCRSPGAGGIANFNYGGQLQLTEVHQDKFMVIPKPIYLTVEKGQSCIENYEFQIVGDLTSDTVCVRADMSELSCLSLGCPVSISYTYLCSSSGMCVEEIFQARGCQTDNDCDSGQLCNTETGVCWLEVIYENIIQCSDSQDCANPCVGVSASCIENKCSWIGSCDPIISKSIIECDSGESWDYSTRPLCKGLEANCIKDKWVFDGNCIDPSDIITVPDQTKWWFLTGIIVLGLLISFVLYLIFKKKK